MARLPFTVSARTARLIGRENVATAHGAVTELVKNAYDADAGLCSVLFIPRWRSLPNQVSSGELQAIAAFDESAIEAFREEEGVFKVDPQLSEKARAKLEEAARQVLDLWIVDTGHGMAEAIVRDHWMVIGTDTKALNARSAGGRAMTGAKGIGRFALDRLGRESELYSAKSGDNSIIHWIVDWADFEGAGKHVSDVEAILESEPGDLKSIYKDHGLCKLLPKRMPSEEGEGAEVDYSTGTAIRIGLLHDRWAPSEALKLKDTLASLLPPNDRPDFDIHLFDYRSPLESGYIEGFPPDQFDYRLVANVAADGQIDITINRREIDPSKIRPSVFEREAMQQPGYTKEDFDRGEIVLQTDLSSLLKIEEDEALEPYRRVGPFSFTLYFFKLQNPNAGNVQRFAQRNFDTVSRRAWLSQSGGIRLYRDNFRVRPYGEPDSQAYDWLSLGERKAQNPAGATRTDWKVPPQQIAGTLFLTKEGNPLLDDQSNREGIRNEHVFRSFRQIVLALINKFEKDRSYILQQFDEAYKSEHPPGPDKEEALRTYQKYKSGDGQSRSDAPPLPIPGASEGSADDRNAQTDIKIVGDALESEVQRNVELEGDIRVLRGMATLGTVLLSFTHELKQIKANMNERGDLLRNAISSVTDPEKLADIPKPAQPLEILRRIEGQDVKVSRWVDFALSAISPIKRRRRRIDLQEYIAGLQAYWDAFLTQRKIVLSVDLAEDKELTVLAHEIDLDSVFYNLINNSVEAFVRPSEAIERKIELTVGLDGEQQIIVTYGDNGPGLSKEFNVADDIFAWGASSKRNDGDSGEPVGTGIGMWLLKNVIDDYGGKTELRSKLGEPGFKIAFWLPLYQRRPSGGSANA